MSPSKYSDYHRQETKKQPKIHPVWRGVGCAFLVLTPVIAWAGTDLIMQNYIKTGKLAVPVDMIMVPGQFLYRFKPDDPYLYVEIFAFIMIAFFCYMILLMLSLIITRLVMGDPARADPYYVPQMTRPRKRVR